jgi:hypothetical protein
MTPQEQQLLQGLTDRINQTVLPDKDPEAEQFINQALGRNPDATYILAQTVLVQQYALDQAKKQLDDAKQQLQQAQQQAQQAPPAPVHHTSFLGSLLGNDAPSRPAPPPPPQYQPVPNYAPPPPAYAQPQYIQPSYGAPVFGGPTFGGPAYGGPIGGSGFLGSALRTAGGVAAGALAFEGIESLMHGFGEHAGYGAGNFGSGQPREEVINNYYGDSDKGEHGGVSRDIEDRRDDNSKDDRADFADTGGTTDDTSSLDDSTTDDSSNNFDDNSASFDDSSSLDDSGSDNNF